MMLHGGGGVSPLLLPRRAVTVLRDATYSATQCHTLTDRAC